MQRAQFILFPHAESEIERNLEVLQNVNFEDLDDVQKAEAFYQLACCVRGLLQVVHTHRHYETHKEVS